MNDSLDTQALVAMGVQVAVLSAGRYALPVRFRVRGPLVECRIPTWSGVGDLLGESGEVTLVALVETGPDLRWVFLRGPATVVPDPDWVGLLPARPGRVRPDALYQLLRIHPNRIERADEQRGWGFRETIDL